MPCGYNDLRAVRSATSEKMPSVAFPLRLYPYAIVVLRAVHSAIQVEPSALLPWQNLGSSYNDFRTVQPS